jgi:hypothetical protein
MRFHVKGGVFRDYNPFFLLKKNELKYLSLKAEKKKSSFDAVTNYLSRIADFASMMVKSCGSVWNLAVKTI